jgi:CRISPR type III-A-associated protein Csm2
MPGPEAALVPTNQRISYLRKVADRTAIEPRLIDEDAQQIAKQLSKEGLETTQLRRFYEPVVGLRQRALAGRVSFEDIKAELLMLKARAAYAWKRKNVPESLVRFFTEHAHWVGNLDEFKAFCRHFEAAVAYHRAFSEK